MRRRDIVLLHSSLRTIGWVLGGATTVVHAFLDVLGVEGTLVTPAQTPENRDPSRWTDPWVPEERWEDVRSGLPAFDPVLTPSGGMGAIAERVRTWPGSRRSAHPQTSFAAIGAAAEQILVGHVLDSPLGERSPLATLERHGGRCLLLGVGYDRCTAFHLAEYRLPDPPQVTNSCAVQTAGGADWVTYQATALDSSDFAELGSAFESITGGVVVGRVGAATARLFDIVDAVGFAQDWFAAHRPHREAGQ